MSPTSTDALVLVDKPVGPTSFDVVRQVGRAVGTRRAGHSGTLDPFASGLLVVLTGRATRCIRFVPAEPKVYLTRIAFGTERDTDDLTGAVTVEAAPPTPDVVLAAIPRFVGTFDQEPSTYSAKKVDGQRAYALARRGRPVVLAPVPVTVHDWEVLGGDGSFLDVRITCGSGTYVRALARDLGRACGSAAHLTSLRRERVGQLDVRDATTWQALQAGDVRLQDPRAALGHLPVLRVDGEGASRIRHGAAVAAEGPDAPAVVMEGPGGEWLGIGERRGALLHPTVVLGDA